ncbi:hypothetical protein DUI87_32166 [Hirundo rustica rustica]|uniref:Uncharacterized protein n=1 Tax=Hirundo rustica rustica TaxID=333673 RepID=A0A3M0IRX6_HIRRU|nr:hypothetical protein DUI87_32166 [Hirundo rustica rustica]
MAKALCSLQLAKDSSGAERFVCHRQPELWSPQGPMQEVALGNGTALACGRSVMDPAGVASAGHDGAAASSSLSQKALLEPTLTKTWPYQPSLAVDYLLADEGGICGKFISSDCCLEINDRSKVIKNISKEICKLAKDSSGAERFVCHRQPEMWSPQGPMREVALGYSTGN